MEATISNGTYTAMKKSGGISGISCGIAESSYYCTDLIIDSYNLAGIKNSLSEWVPTMINQWSGLPGGTVIRSNDTHLVQPGDVIFWLDSSGAGQHVDVVSNVTIDQSTGIGTISTYDANTWSVTNRWSVVGWRITTQWIGSPLYPWFGLVKCI